MPASPKPPSRWYEHKIPPPVIDFAVGALMWALARGVPSAQLWPAQPWSVTTVVGLSIALAGGGFALAGALAFRRARTTVNPLSPHRASALVTNGIYRFTRNPMYLGMLLVLAGWAVYLGNAVAFVGLPLFVAVLNALQIKPEERILRERFGEHFTRYAGRVRRWM
ncbi:isoprenylcysteine carboxylmethyltransferase family protein [Ottowia sp. SB7-C50]|uniref:methyltransferase family protein n=1 Tax=Ottowia sp. SB7-C50 TaxID=3081231 RepID=UPI0029532CDF|nr:isoprenylcysteine carboxylmethyltransferase family protein [Ottowia sp. SB7-C50]WOP14531.1 isoprenylcysteine carboxylmethyltransferase family protein [Ottowia sp. SB7-C50]